jgi:hypothetical protein
LDIVAALVLPARAASLHPDADHRLACQSREAHERMHHARIASVPQQVVSTRYLRLASVSRRSARGGGCLAKRRAYASVLACARCAIVDGRSPLRPAGS